MQYVMVDEFQDVSRRQYKIAQILSKRHGNLFIVGDTDQTIYSWRGSHVKLFLDFDRVYPDAKTVVLKENYRSTPEILRAADSLIVHNEVRFKKNLNATRKSGSRPFYFHAKSDAEEAAWIRSQISELCAGGLPMGQVAVLYRAHYLSRALEECFIENGLAYTIYSGIEFYGRREVKDVVCYLRMVTAGDDVAFLRTVNLPSRKIGKKKIEAIKAYAESRNLSLYDALMENLDTDMLKGTQAKRYVGAIEFVRAGRGEMALGDAMQTLLDMSGYEEFLRLQGDQERLDNVAELTRAVKAAGEDEEATLEDFLSKIALFTNLDHEGSRETVKLMTVHTAKGMEFSAVFVCGLSEGVFPSRRTYTPEDMAEERRLCYVAMTRAKDNLFLSDSEGRGNDGLFKYPSRFIFEAGADNVEYARTLDSALIEDTKRHILADEQKLKISVPVFKEGDRVRHIVFGEGTVAAVETAAMSYSVLLDTLKTDRSIRFGAKLQAAKETGEES